MVGTYQHPKIGRNEAFCLIGEHDASRLQYIFSQLNRYDFKHCIYQLKVGVAVNTMQFLIAGIEGMLLLGKVYEGMYVSAWMCVLENSTPEAHEVCFEVFRTQFL